MTALKKYQRLECIGLWRSDLSAQRREVILSFGKATLVLTDSQNRVLSHWSLAAVEVQKGKMGEATLRPGAEAEETIEIKDKIMLEALLKVRKEINQTGAHPGKLRLIIAIVTLIAISSVTIFLGPPALVSYASKVLPTAKRLQLGQAIRQHIGQLAGPYCENPEGTIAVQKLAKRLNSKNLKQILVLPGYREKAIVIPGGIVILFKNMIKTTSNPEVTAGYILSALADYENEEPIQLHLSKVGFPISLSLIISNELSETQIDKLAKNALALSPHPASNSSILNKFRTTQVSSTPFARILSNKNSEYLINNDPYPENSPNLVLPDGAWLGLQAICLKM
tara:strand:- start:918 stop:1931 length:1014 start_codon:yes stop_codon:yes gene_type:complete